MSLMSQLKKQTSGAKAEKKFGAEMPSITLTTGFPTFDYFNGKIGLDPVTGKPILFSGLNAGKSIMIVGPTGSGKSTLAYQMAYNLVKSYENGGIVVLDYEGAFSDERFYGVTGATHEWFEENVQVKSKGVYSETLMNYVVEIHNLKKSMKDSIMVDNPNGVVDPETGEVAKMYPPTALIIDSVAVMRPIKFSDSEDAELAGPTAAGRISQVNGEIFKRLIQLCLETNIYIVSVNHLTAKMSPNGLPVPADIKGMSQQDHIPGGKSVSYISDTLLIVQLKDRLDPNKTDKNKWHIDGYEAEVKMVKSRNPAANRMFNLIFDQYDGFSPELSMVNDLLTDGVITGRGSAYKLPNLDMKFALCDVKELWSTNPEFKNALLAAYHEYGVNNIRTPRNIRTQFTIEENPEIIDESVAVDDMISDNTVLDV